MKGPLYNSLLVGKEMYRLWVQVAVLHLPRLPVEWNGAYFGYPFIFQTGDPFQRQINAYKIMHRIKNMHKLKWKTNTLWSRQRGIQNALFEENVVTMCVNLWVCTRRMGSCKPIQKQGNISVLWESEKMEQECDLQILSKSQCSIRVWTLAGSSHPFYY